MLSDNVDQPGRPVTTTTAALTIDSLYKTFGGTRATNNVSMSVNRGEIVGLVGHNGAGKSTLVKMIAGALSPDEGTILIAGETLRAQPAQALRLGVRSIQQSPTLLPNLSVADNVAILHRDGLLRNRRAARRLCRERLGQLDCRLDPDILAGTLSPGTAQEVEIARGLDDDINLLVLDEPTASLSAPEATRLHAIMKRLARRMIGQLIISHDLAYILDVADRVVVLRDGAVVQTRPATQWTRSTLVESMMGQREPQQAGRTPSARVNRRPVVEVQNLRTRTLQDVTLTVSSGEIVGVTGVIGSGIDELARVLGGVELPDSGHVLVQGKPFRPATPRKALQRGVAYLPSDRARSALFANLSVVDQTGITRLALAGAPVIRRNREWRLAVATAGAVGLPVHRLRLRPSALSGGNQQKAVVGRLLQTAPAVFIAHEPTVGVDVGARAAIHEQLRLLTQTGAAVVVVSSDTEEISLVGDRCLVLRGGRIVFESDVSDEATLVRAAVAPEGEAARRQSDPGLPSKPSRG